MEDNKLLSYAQLREKIVSEGKKYFQNPRFLKPNFEIRIREEEDTYHTQIDMVYLSDLNHLEIWPPAYDLMVTYENYCRSKSADKVIRTLVEMMEKQYPKEEVPIMDDAPQVNIITTQVEGNEDVASAYMITDEHDRCSLKELLSDDKVLIPIAEKEQANLQMLPLGDDTVLAVPVHNLEEYEENLEVMAELLHLELEHTPELDSQVYDRSRNLLLKNPEEIKELLIKGKVQKKGIFLR